MSCKPVPSYYKPSKDPRYSGSPRGLVFCSCIDTRPATRSYTRGQLFMQSVLDEIWKTRFGITAQESQRYVCYKVVGTHGAAFPAA